MGFYHKRPSQPPSKPASKSTPTKLKARGGSTPRVKLIRHRPQLVYDHPGPEDPVYARRRHTIMSLLNEIEVHTGPFYYAMRHAIHALMTTDTRLADEFVNAYANLLEAEKEYDDDYYEDVDEPDDDVA
jgi:hypothetical protein